MDRVQLCKEIESAINNEYRHLYNEDDLSEVHSALFPSYDKWDYVCVFHEGMWLTGDESKILLDTSRNIGELEVDVQDILAKYDLSEDDVDYLNQEYCYDHGFDWDGLYEIFRRVSCWCCPLQSLSELRKRRLFLMWLLTW